MPLKKDELLPHFSAQADIPLVTITYLSWVFLWEYFVERALSETARRRLLGFTLSEFAPGEPNTMLARLPQAMEARISATT
jgi:hypothetical protein